MFHVGEAAVLSVFEFASEFFGVGAPATEGFDRDVELLIDAEEVVIVLVEQVEGFDFGIEAVVVRHGWESFG